MEDYTAWVDWWSGCVPNEAVGPGVRGGCDGSAAWESALLLCWLRCIGSGGDVASCLGQNFVSYAWVDERCVVLDAECNVVYGADAFPWVFLGLLSGATPLNPSGGDPGAGEGWTPSSGDSVSPMTNQSLTGDTGPTGPTGDTGDPAVDSFFDDSGWYNWDNWDDWNYDGFWDRMTDDERAIYLDAFEDFSEMVSSDLEQVLDLCRSGVAQNQAAQAFEDGLGGEMDPGNVFCTAAFEASQGSTSSDSGSGGSNFFDPWGTADPCGGLFTNC